MNIFLFGLNHKSAPVEIREQIAFTKDELYRTLEKSREMKGIRELVILSTCNRTEFYLLLDPGANGLQIIDQLLRLAGKTLDIQQNTHFYILHDAEAIAHLFRVTAGMDSMVLGEPQIQGQVKEAFEIALELKTIRAIFSRLYQAALIAGKRVRSETDIARGAVSVAYAATELAQKIFRTLEEKSALLIGAGETGELTATHLLEKGVKKLWITNRTFNRAVELAEKLGGEAIPFGDYPKMLETVDVVISSTGSPEPVLTVQNSSVYLEKRRKPILLIDIAVPRDIDPSLNRYDFVFLHNIDSLNQIVEKNLQKRKSEIPKAEMIITEEVLEFQKWYDSLSLKPFIQTLQNSLRELKEEEMKKFRNKFNNELWPEVDYLVQRILNKIFHKIITTVKEDELNQREKIALFQEIFRSNETDKQLEKESNKA